MRAVATGGYIGIYTPSKKNQSTLNFFYVVFVSMTQDKFELTFIPTQIKFLATPLANIRVIDSVNSFKCALNTFLFR